MTENGAELAFSLKQNIRQEVVELTEIPPTSLVATIGYVTSLQ